MMEEITSGLKVLALVLRAGDNPDSTAFVTPPEASLQAGLVVIPPNGEAPRHIHPPIERTIDLTAESMLVRTGACEVDVFDEDRSLVKSVAMEEGDLVIFLGIGGHGVRTTEGTILLEFKQGPFGGDGDKERF